MTIKIDLEDEEYTLITDAVKDARKKAISEIGDLQIKQDGLVVNGETLLTAKTFTFKNSTSMTNYNDSISIPTSVFNATPALLKENITYDNGTVSGAIPNTVKNGEYASEGSVTYSSFTTGKSAVDLVNDTGSLSKIVVHTPVVCKLKYPTDAYVEGKLTLEGGKNYSVGFDAYQHITSTGYGNKTFEKYTGKRYIKSNFDMYVNDTAVNAGTWVEVGKTFNLKVNELVHSGDGYTIESRTQAVNYNAITTGNATGSTTYVQANANTTRTKYAASSSNSATIVNGWIYDFNIYDVNDYPLWQPIFRKPNSVLGTNNKYRGGPFDYQGNRVIANNKLTLPLLNGSHLISSNSGAVKLGYAFRFNLTTRGALTHANDYVQIAPRFYYVKKDGTGKKEVDLYYNETINGKKKHYVKVGSTTDQSNLKTMNLGNVYSNVSYQEINNTARLTSKSPSVLKYTDVNAYSYGNIKLSSALRTFCGSIEGIPLAEQDKAIMNTQKWYGEYHLPSETYAVDKGYDVQDYARKSSGLTGKESFWLKDGYIIVNFDIKAYQYNASTNSHSLYLEYAATDKNMWAIEGYTLTKKDNLNNTFSLSYGDVVFYYTLYQNGIKTNADSDYQTGGTH